MTKIKSYRLVKEITTGEYKERGSKFLAFVFPCDNIDFAKLKIDELRKEHPNAVHVCFAWRFGKSKYEERYSDDGEPNNSAGKPIFGQIIANDITNVMIAVVRYYGGTNLGVGGLINAYRTASQSDLEKSTIEEKYISDFYELLFSYEETGTVMNLLHRYNVEIVAQNFDTSGPSIQFKCQVDRSALILQSFENPALYKLRLIETEA